MALPDDDTLLARWLNNTLTDAEKTALEQHPEFPEFKRIAETAASLVPPDAETARLWPAMEATVRQSATPVRKPLKLGWLWATSAAAAIAALVIFVWQPWNNGPLIVQTGIGEEKTVTLADGSIIKLNAVSKVVVQRDEWSERRRIELEGEAFFDVQKNPEAPFTVTTPNGKVTVLGTSFCVFDREKNYSVACYRGLVRAESMGQNMEVPETRKISTDGHGSWTNSEVNEGDIPAWLRGNSDFRDAPVELVIAELERQYDIKIEAKIPPNKHYTGTFPNKNLDLALKILCESLELSYRANGKNVILETK